MDARQRRPAAPRAVSLAPGTALAAVRLGQGSPLVLVHGGADPELTWSNQLTLARRWRLVIPWRRGFPPSPSAERQDFEADADDIDALLEAEGGAHLVGFSYGGVGAAIAAARRPALVRSLTLIEPALLGILPGDPEVRELISLAAAALAGEDPAAVARFLRLAGLDGPFPAPERDRTIRRASGFRPPWTANPELRTLATAGTPSLVVSGGHSQALERVCDETASQLAGERLVLRGHGHAVQRSPRFNRALEHFLSAHDLGRDCESGGAGSRATEVRD